jgi:GTP-binding protein EngB required for normal cell division
MRLWRGHLYQNIFSYLI